jgi:hypothetical protein
VNPGRGQCMVGSLTGAVSSKRVTEECEGTLGTVGNRADSAMAKACLTARLTSRAGAKAGHSDPVVLYGRAIAQRILAPRCRLITSWGCSRSQGYGCSPFKVVRELGLKRRETVWSLSAVGVGRLRGAAPSTRGPEWTNLWCTGCHASGIAG